MSYYARETTLAPIFMEKSAKIHSFLGDFWHFQDGVPWSRHGMWPTFARDFLLQQRKGTTPTVNMTTQPQE